MNTLKVCSMLFRTKGNKLWRKSVLIRHSFANRDQIQYQSATKRHLSWANVRNEKSILTTSLSHPCSHFSITSYDNICWFWNQRSRRTKRTVPLTVLRDDRRAIVVPMSRAYHCSTLLSIIAWYRRIGTQLSLIIWNSKFQYFTQSFGDA